MIEIYTTLIIKDKKRLNDVPFKLREQVKITLVELGYERLIKEEE